MIFNELWMFVSMLLQRLDHYTNNNTNNISSNSRTNNIRSSLDLPKGSSSSSSFYQKTPAEVVQAVFSSSWSSVLRYAPLLDELSTVAPMSLKAASPDFSQQLRIGCSSYAYGQHHGK